MTTYVVGTYTETSAINNGKIIKLTTNNLRQARASTNVFQRATLP